MPLVFNFAAHSHVGQVRAKNDDSGYAGHNLAVVADGMGGHVGGDVASSSTVLDLTHLDHPDLPDAATALPDEIQTANSILNQLVQANPKLSGMGTTCTSILLSGETIHLAHVGDSRAYRLKDGTFEQVTRDHSFVQRLIEEGQISADEAETHPHKNVLMRVLGDVDASPELDVSTHPATPGERWLLCSDGLNAVLTDKAIEHAMRSDKTLNDIAMDLVQDTLAGGAPDNVTVVVVDVATTDAPAAPTVPATPISAEATPQADADQADRSGAFLRQVLSTRPHTLVGAAELATQTGQIPIVTKRSAQKRASQVLTHHEDEINVDDVDEDEPLRRSWLLPTFVTLLAVLLAVVTWLGYAWTQTQYYVGANDGKVAIYNGVAQSIGPISLSHVDTQTEIRMAQLPTYTRQRVETGLAARDLSHAQQIVKELSEAAVVPEPTPSPTPSASPTPSTSPTPTRKATPTPTTTLTSTGGGNTP